VEFNAPVRTTKYPREIPPLPWYRSTLPQMAMAGFLPFSAIYIELYYIFASVWGHKVYTIYSILFIVFIILIIVTAFITIALTYFQLAVEDHEWWWRSAAAPFRFLSLFYRFFGMFLSSFVPCSSGTKIITANALFPITFCFRRRGTRAAVGISVLLSFECFVLCLGVLL
jgi:hypothetical protein